MKKCAFIIPYFGKFNNYFQLFLNSCKYNQDYDWLIFTDDKTQYDYPENVKVQYTTFKWLENLIREKLDIMPHIQDMHKICDFKPAYGLIFEDYLKDYDFWGHCDCDLIFGNLNDFLTDELLLEYDKIFTQGHCILYKNVSDVNKAFMLELNDKRIYKDILEDSKTLAFDEEYLPNNVNQIFIQNKFKVFEQDYSANISRKHGDFRIVHFDPLIRNYLEEEKQKSLYVWDKGQLLRFEKKFGTLIKSPLLYIHLQSRIMKVNVSQQEEILKITPNRFEKLEVAEVNETNFEKIKKTHFNTYKIKMYKDDVIFWYNKIVNKLRRK